MEEFDDKTKLLYKLTFEDGFNAQKVSREMEKAGYTVDYRTVQKFKNKLFKGLDREARKERMVESMLESFDRTKIEFEDSIRGLKSLIESFEKKGETENVLAARRDLNAQINVALKVLGKMNSQVMNLRADKVTITNSTDFLEAFRSSIFGYFDTMKATNENGKIVFNQPTPEFMDDYNKWVANKGGFSGTRPA